MGKKRKKDKFGNFPVVIRLILTPSTDETFHLSSNIQAHYDVNFTAFCSK